MRRALFVLAFFALCNATRAEDFVTYIPQVADGEGWTTQINIASTTTPTEGRVRFFRSDGSPLILAVSVSGLGHLMTNSVEFSTDGYDRTFVIESQGTSAPASIGYAEIEYTGPSEVAANGLFRFSGGDVAAEAGIDAATVAGTQIVPVDIREGVNVGIALVTASSNSVHSFSLIDSEGTQIASNRIRIDKHAAKYVPELFPNVEVPSTFKGAIRIGESRCAATALRVAADLSTLSSLPVEPMPSHVPPLFDAVANGPTVLIGVACENAQVVDCIRFEVQVTVPRTEYTYFPVLSIFQGYTGIFNFAPPHPGTYRLRARVWNGSAPGVFTPIMDVNWP